MAKLFSTDGKVYRFMVRLTDILTLNFLWIICSLPLVTLGVSTIAAFSVTLRMAEDSEGKITKDFFKAFKANIRQGIFMSVLTLLAAWAVYLNIQIILNIDSGIAMLITSSAAVYVIALSFLYVYPLLARYQNSIFNSLKNSFRISLRYFLRTLLILFAVALEILVIAWNGTTLLAGALIGPACIMLTVSGPAMSIFRIADKGADTE